MSIIGKRRAVDTAAQKPRKASEFGPPGAIFSLEEPCALYEFSFSVYEFAFRHMKVRQSQFVVGKSASPVIRQLAASGYLRKPTSPFHRQE
jgi:hypothetical protein